MASLEYVILTLEVKGDHVSHIVVLNQISESKEKLKELTCPICHELFKDPVQLNNHKDNPCQHIFCRGCITRHLKPLGTGKKCPMCRMPTKLKNAIPASLVRRALGGIKLCCAYKDKGCEWNCSMGPAAVDYLGHVKVCPLRGQPCEDCKEIVVWSFVDAEAKTRHEIVCLERLRDCSFCHEFKGKLVDLDLHKMTSCPEYPLACEFKHYGLEPCQPLMPRKNYLLHCTKNMTQHVGICNKAHDEVKKLTGELTTKRKMQETLTKERVNYSRRWQAKLENPLFGNAWTWRGVWIDNEYYDVKLMARSRDSVVVEIKASPGFLFPREAKIIVSLFDKYAFSVQSDSNVTGVNTSVGFDASKMGHYFLESDDEDDREVYIGLVVE